MDVAELELRVNAAASTEEVRNLRREMQLLRRDADNTNQQTTRGANTLTGAISSLRGGVAALGATFAALGIGMAVQEFIQAEQELLRLRSALTATNQATLEYEQRLVGMANSIQTLTRFSDEQVMVVQRQLVMAGAQQKNIESLTRLTLDYAEATGQSAEAVGGMLGKAMQGQTAIFSRMGFQIDQTKTKTEQLRDIIAEMQRRSQGAAELLGASDIGAVAKASNAISDLKEELGKLFLILGRSGLEDFVSIIKDITDAVKMMNQAFEGFRTDNPFIKFITTSPLRHWANIWKAGGSMSNGKPGEALSLLTGGDPFKEMRELQEQARAAKNADTGLEDIVARPDPEEIFKAQQSLDQMRLQLRQMSAPNAAVAAEMGHISKFKNLADDLENLKDVLGENAEEMGMIDSFFADALAKQDKIVKNAVVLAQLQEDMMAGTKKGLVGSIAETRGAAGRATTTEDFAQEQQKLAMMMAERQRRLEFNISSPADSFAAGWQQAAESFGSTSERIANTAQGLAQSMEQNISGALMSIVDGTMDAREAFAKMATAIVQDLIRVAIQELVVKQMLSAFVMHGGGVVGGGLPDRNVGADSFIGAGRYAQGGVAGDEVPVIAHRGEVILNEDQQGSLMKGMSQRPKVEVINVMDPAMVDERLAKNPGAVVNVISMNRQQIRQALGLR